MANQRAIAAHLVLSVSRIQQLQYAGVIKKDASLDCARLSYIRWLSAYSGIVSGNSGEMTKAFTINRNTQLCYFFSETT